MRLFGREVDPPSGAPAREGKTTMLAALAEHDRVTAAAAEATSWLEAQARRRSEMNWQKASFYYPGDPSGYSLVLRRQCGCEIDTVVFGHGGCRWRG